MSIREIISGFLVPIEKGNSTDDSIWSNAYIYHLMKIARSTLIYERLRDPMFNFNLATQTLDCIELELAEKNECCEKLPSGCKWLKSKKIIPDTINNTITKVYNDRGDVYTRVLNESDKSFKKYSFSKDSDFKFIIKNNHLFVPDLESPKWIKMEAIFYDAMAVKANCNSSCNLLDSEFPMDPRLVDKMYDIMTMRIMKTFPYFTDDKINDSDNTNSYVPPPSKTK